jgi:hypothetical protein
MTMRTRIGITTLALSMLLGMSSLAALAQFGGPQVMGTAQSITDNLVTLTDGGSFTVNDQTRVTIVTPATAADLVPGQYVAITARPGESGELEASIISSFPDSSTRANEGQFPMNGGNLMTNATIDDAVLDAIDGGEMTVSYLGETGQVHITGDTRIELRTTGSLSDIVPGEAVSANVTDGVARSVSVFQ